MTNQTEPKESTSNKQISLNRILILLGIGALPIGILSLFIQVPPICACGDGSKEKIGTFIRAQQAYFLENSTFADSYRALRIDSKDAPTDSRRYQYSVELSKDMAFIYAIPKEVPTDLLRLGLTKTSGHSLVGAIAYDRKLKTTVEIRCKSEQESLVKPPKPAFNGEKFTCPLGFTPNG